MNKKALRHAFSEVLDAGAVTAQITFACEKNDPGLLEFPAEQKYFDMYDEARKSESGHLIAINKEIKPEVICLNCSRCSPLKARH